MSKDHSSRTLPYFPSGDLSEEKKKTKLREMNEKEEKEENKMERLFI